jgi:exoribonuclease R
MNNDNYDFVYTKHIETLYGPKRNYICDTDLIKHNILPHIYNITDRRDLTDLETYSIDPDGCEDADDAFSIYFENNKLYLAIHIADPTEFINLDSELWTSIEKTVITKYPSNTKPIHLIPDVIMQISSLMDNEFGDTKNAITILTEINTSNYLPCHNIQLLFSRIRLKKENSLSYYEASCNINNNDCLNFGLKISKSLQQKRMNRTIGVKLNELNSSNIKYHNHIPYLYIDSQEEKDMKQMIAEFAIFANSFVGEYLKINFNQHGIFRTCNASDIIHNEHYKNLSGNDLLHEIITNGIHADYLNTVASHDLVGSDEYTHFTSPIRRASDCICHYLLKYLHLKKLNIDLKVPFQLDKLQELSEKCVIESKKIKRIQYKDTKFRLIQIMNLLLYENEYIQLSFYITSYKEPFLNVIINKINEHHVYLSYSLKINKVTNYIHNPNVIHNINILFVNIPGKFDEGSIPELDDYIFSMFL